MLCCIELNNNEIVGNTFTNTRGLCMVEVRQQENSFGKLHTNHVIEEFSCFSWLLVGVWYC